jgi:pyrroline-5-carboxylate reductase
MAESITLVGYGNMGRALAAGWVAHGRPPATITIVDPSGPALEVARSAGFVTSADAPAGDVVVLAVKPQLVDDVARQFAGRAGDTVFLSIAAGRTIAGILAALGGTGAVVRAMPNTPAAIGRGVTGLCAGPDVDDRQRSLCDTLLAAVGRTVWVDDERLLDAVTAVSGSGPAYVFLLIECLARAGRTQGLDADVAATLALETVAGAGAYAAVADVDAAELRRRVTSPQGTTEAALDVLLADSALAALLERAVAAATDRSRELAGGS